MLGTADWPCLFGRGAIMIRSPNSRSNPPPYIPFHCAYVLSRSIFELEKMRTQFIGGDANPSPQDCCGHRRWLRSQIQPRHAGGPDGCRDADECGLTLAARSSLHGSALRRRSTVMLRGYSIRLRIRRVPIRTLSSMSTSLQESSTVVWVGGRFGVARTTRAPASADNSRSSPNNWPSRSAAP